MISSLRKFALTAINRFFALDARAYEPGALRSKTKGKLGLVASLVPR
jgi:hypothetical protein